MGKSLKMRKAVMPEHYAHEIDFPVYSKKDKVLLIDADILAFKVASVCEARYRFTNKVDEDDVYLAKSIKEFEAYLDDEKSTISRKILKLSEKYVGKTKDDWTELDSKRMVKLRKNLSECLELTDFYREDVQIADPFEYCAKTLDDALNRVLKKLKIKKFEMYIGGSENFRSSLPLPLEYKVSVRKNDIRPIHLTAAKEYLMKKYGAIKVKGIEADDVLQMRQFILFNLGVKVTMYSNDKDRKQGWYGDYYNPDTEQVETLDSYLGSIKDTGKGVGMKWLMFQMSQGDPIDGYSPKQWYSKLNYKRGYGAKSFHADFHECSTMEELLNQFITVHRDRLLIQDIYEWDTWDGRHVKANWLGIMELMYSCAYMKLEIGDTSTFSSLCTSHGVDAGELIWEVTVKQPEDEELGCVDEELVDKIIEENTMKSEVVDE